MQKNYPRSRLFREIHMRQLHEKLDATSKLAKTDKEEAADRTFSPL